MRRKGISIAIGLSLITAATLYLITKKKNPKEPQTLKDQAKQLFTAGKYAEALKLYLQALSLAASDATLTKSLLNNISLCYFLLKDYVGAVNYASKVIEIDPTNIKVLKRRFESHKALGLRRDALTDMYLLSQVDGEYESNFCRFLDAVARDEALECAKNAVPHAIYIEEFMKPFSSMIKAYDLEELIDKYKRNDNNGGDVELLFFSSIEIIKGDYDRALGIIGDQDNIFFTIFRAYIRSIKGEDVYDTRVDEIINNLLDFETSNGGCTINEFKNKYQKGDKDKDGIIKKNINIDGIGKDAKNKGDVLNKNNTEINGNNHNTEINENIHNIEINGNIHNTEINENNHVPLLYCSAFIRQNSELFDKILEKGQVSEKPELFFAIKFARLVNSSQINEALKIEKYLDSSPQSLSLRIETYMAIKDYKRLEHVLDEMKNLYPRDPRTFVYFAMKYQALKDELAKNNGPSKTESECSFNEKILRYIDKSIQCDPSYFNSRLFKANFIMSIGNGNSNFPENKKLNFIAGEKLNLTEDEKLNLFRNEKLNLFKDAFKCASRVDEFLSVCKPIYLLEMEMSRNNQLY